MVLIHYVLHRYEMQWFIGILLCWFFFCRFLYELSQIPNFTERAQCIIFQSVFSEGITSVHRKVDIITRVSKVSPNGKLNKRYNILARMLLYFIFYYLLCEQCLFNNFSAISYPCSIPTFIHIFAHSGSYNKSSYLVLPFKRRHK